MRTKRFLLILVVAFLITILLRIFVFDTVRIASHAMDSSQAIGDRLLIEKWTIGARMPQYFSKPELSSGNKERIWFEITEKQVRVPGFSHLKRNNLIVFNDPRVTGNTPPDHNSVLISRCIGLPGDFIQLKGQSVSVNRKRVERPIDATRCYRYSLIWKSNDENLIANALPNKEMFHGCASGYVFMTDYEYCFLREKAINKQLHLKPYISANDVRNAIVPFKGYSININERTVSIWGSILEKYENVNLKRYRNGKFLINGKIADSYTFKQNYYWVMNDHQGYTNDSRTFGPIPESLVIGKACLLLYSPEKKRLLQKI